MPRPVLTIKQPYTPEMLADAADAIAELLTPESEVFEFGGGYSTVWLAGLAKRVVYVEHDDLWYEETDRALREAHRVSRARGVFVEDEDEIGSVIDRYGDFDMVLVDCLDRQRVSAVQYALAHVKPGGYLVLDDSQWPMLQEARKLMASLDWPRTKYAGWHRRKNGERRWHETEIWQNTTPLALGDEEE